jgi:hypothetical protein
LLTGDVVQHPLSPVGGLLPVMPYSPAPDANLLQQHAMSPERETYWRERIARVATLAFS